LFGELERAGGSTADREQVRTEIKRAMLATAQQVDPEAGKGEAWFEGLFGWHSRREGRGFLLRARPDGHTEFEPNYAAVGSSRQLGEFGFFGFSRAEFLDYRTLPLETSKMLTMMVAEDAVKASAQGVSLPIQLAVASTDATSALGAEELEAVTDTVTAYRMHQLDFLKRTESPGASAGVPGLIPGDRGN
jgi:hypothetical protein